MVRDEMSPLATGKRFAMVRSNVVLPARLDLLGNRFHRAAADVVHRSLEHSAHVVFDLQTNCQRQFCPSSILCVHVDLVHNNCLAVLGPLGPQPLV